MTSAEANKNGYIPITSGYNPETDQEMLDRAVQQLEGKNICLVKYEGQVFIGRLKEEVDTITA